MLKVVILLSFFLFVVSFDDVDGIHNLGRAPIISEWEGRQMKEQIKPLSAHWMGMLNKTDEFYSKGKFDLAEKVYLRILDDIEHPDILVSYASFLEKISENQYDSLFYYIYTLHSMPSHSKAFYGYNRVLKNVIETERELFRIIDSVTTELQTLDIFDEISLEVIQSVFRKKRIEYIYHTNAIEGSTLTYEVAKYVIETGMNPISGSFRLLDLNEVWGSLDAFDFSAQFALEAYNEAMEIDSGDQLYIAPNSHQQLLSTPPVIWHDSQIPDYIYSDDSYQSNNYLWKVLLLHKKIFGRIMPEEAGVLRRTRIVVAGYVPPPHEDLPYLMEQFGKWLSFAETSKKLHVIEKAALAHFQLTWIHPFIDGNGRTARMLMNLILMENGYPPITIQVDDREEYYDVLRKSQQSGDTRPFIYFIYRIATRSIKEYIDDIQLELQDNEIQPLNYNLNIQLREIQ